MGWTIATFLFLAAVSHAVMLVRPPGRRVVAALGYASLVLLALALVCGAAAWHSAETERAKALAARGASDRDFVVLIHAIDAARDNACNTPPPKSTDAALLEAYTRMRTTCAYYATVWIEAGRATDLPGVLAAAEKPWPAAGSPRHQLWSYGPLAAEAARIDAAMHRSVPSATGRDARLAQALPLVLAVLLAVSLTAVTAGLLSTSRRSVNAPPPPSSAACAAAAPPEG